MLARVRVVLASQHQALALAHHRRLFAQRFQRRAVHNGAQGEGGPHGRPVWMRPSGRPLGLYPGAHLGQELCEPRCGPHLAPFREGWQTNPHGRDPQQPFAGQHPWPRGHGRYPPPDQAHDHGHHHGQGQEPLPHAHATLWRPRVAPLHLAWGQQRWTEPGD
jgi:hypothetical protein